MSNKLWQLLTKETPAGTMFRHCTSNYIYKWDGNGLQTDSGLAPLLQKLLFDEWEIILKEKSFHERLNEMSLYEIIESIRIAVEFGTPWRDDVSLLLLRAFQSLGTKYPELKMQLSVKNDKDSYLVCEINQDTYYHNNPRYAIAHAIARYCYQKGLIK